MFNESTDLTKELIFARDNVKDSFVNDDDRRRIDKFFDKFIEPIGKKIESYFYDHFFKKSSLFESLKKKQYHGDYGYLGKYTTIDKMLKLPLSHPIMMYKEEENLICRRCGVGLHCLNKDVDYYDICERCGDKVTEKPINKFEQMMKV